MVQEWKSCLSPEVIVREYEQLGGRYNDDMNINSPPSGSEDLINIHIIFNNKYNSDFRGTKKI